MEYRSRQVESFSFLGVLGPARNQTPLGYLKRPVAVVEIQGPMRKRDVKERIRLRLMARLDELGMTGREFAVLVRGEESDSWISGILSGAQALGWKHFDTACRVLNLSPAEMVRHDEDTVRELTPSEMRLLRHYQAWPRQVQALWLTMLDYFAQQMPDAETARVLEAWEALPAGDRRRLRLFLAREQVDRLPQTDAPAPGPQATGDTPDAPGSTPPPDPAETPTATRRPDADPSFRAPGYDKDEAGE